MMVAVTVNKQERKKGQVFQALRTLHGSYGGFQKVCWSPLKGSSSKKNIFPLKEHDILQI